jgi:hypothetical protein
MVKTAAEILHLAYQSGDLHSRRWFMLTVFCIPGSFAGHKKFSQDESKDG